MLATKKKKHFIEKPTLLAPVTVLNFLEEWKCCEHAMCTSPQF